MDPPSEPAPGSVHQAPQAHPLVGMVLAMSVELGCALAGDGEEFRRWLHSAAALYELDRVGITD